MLFSALAQAGELSKRRRGEAVYPYVLLCPFVLSAAVSLALTALVGWHAYLIWHAQVTLVTSSVPCLCALWIAASLLFHGFIVVEPAHCLLPRSLACRNCSEE